MLIALALAVAAPATDEVTLPQGDALAAALTTRDAEFFALVFEGCDPERLATMLTPDFEMYHDRGGVVARTSEAFVRQYGQDCVARQTPDAWRSRRELVATTLNVHPVPATARSRMASTSSTSARATGRNVSPDAPGSPNCGS